MPTLKTNDFARAFGVDEKEVEQYCGNIIRTRDFRYEVCDRSEREKILQDIIKKCESNSFSVSGSHRQNDWAKGWGQIYQDFIKSGSNLEALIPKDIHGDRPLRYKGDYIISKSKSFELDFSTVFRHWLFNKYFQPHKNVYEFGCGTGHNLVILASLFAEKQYYGMDWVKESQQILAAIAAKYSWKIKGFPFDFFHPDYSLKIQPDSVVYTSAALEQMGNNFKDFINYLLANKPALCVNVEPMIEYYDSGSLFDYAAIRYHQQRNYLNGFLPHLQALENGGKIKIRATKRLHFGSLYHEAYSYIVWEIL
jgi:hypothetical protein